MTVSRASPTRRTCRAAIRCGLQIPSRGRRPALLPGLAGHAILPALMVTLTWLMGSSGIEHGEDRADGGVELFGDLAIGTLQTACLHQRAINLIGEPRAIGASAWMWSASCSRCDRRRGDAPRRSRRRRAGSSIAVSWHRRPAEGRWNGRDRWRNDRSCTQRSPQCAAARVTTRRFSKRLEDELYVASEANARRFEAMDR